MSNRSLNNPRRIIAIVITLVACWLAYRETANLMAWHFAAESARDHPNLDVLPTPLPNTTQAQLDGVTIARFGFSFHTPWKQLDKEIDGNKVTSFHFKDGGGLLLFDPAGMDKVRIMRGNTPQQQAAMRKVFGPDALGSNYGLMTAEVETRPDQVKWWLPASRNTQSFLMLTFKSADMQKANVIYRIDQLGMRGFQFGNPSNPPYVVQLDIFDTDDRHYKLLIVGKDAPVISQPQINALIASLHPLPKTTYEPKPAPS